MKKILLLILSISILGFVQAEPLKPRTTIISGKVINLKAGDPQVVAVNFCDPLNDENKIASRMDPSGEFRSSYPMTFAQNITIAYDNKFINVFVEPSDSVHVLIDMEKFSKGDFSGLVFTGSKSKINNQLAAYCNYFYRLEMPKIDLNQEPDEFLAQIKRTISQMEDTISVYAKKNKLDQFVVKWAKMDLKYLLANNIQSYSSKDPSKALKAFTDPVFDPYNADNFRTMLFPYHLGAIMNAVLRGDTRFMECGKTGDFVGARDRGVELIAKLPSGISRDVMMFSFFQRMSRSDDKSSYEIPKGIFSEQIFYSKAADLFKRAEKMDYPQVELAEFLYLNGDTPQKIEKVDILSYLTSKYKGKVLYIDVYATWCGPCRAEFPAAKQLHKLYHGKEVVFVNLCLASDQKKWIPTVKQLDIEGENYFFAEDQTQLFMSGYGLSGYPSYMLIEKNGELSTNKAPRPSNITGASKAIDELLAK